MGFMAAMKGANNAWGTAVTVNGVGTIGPKNLVNNKEHELIIANTMGDEVVFKKEDIDSIKVIAATSDWIKYALKLKNNFEAIITIMAKEQTNKGVGVSMKLQNFENWLFDIIYR